MRGKGNSFFIHKLILTLFPTWEIQHVGSQSLESCSDLCLALSCKGFWHLKSILLPLSLSPLTCCSQALPSLDDASGPWKGSTVSGWAQMPDHNPPVFMLGWPEKSKILSVPQFPLKQTEEMLLCGFFGHLEHCGVPPHQNRESSLSASTMTSLTKLNNLGLSCPWLLWNGMTQDPVAWDGLENCHCWTGLHKGNNGNWALSSFPDSSLSPPFFMKPCLSFAFAPGSQFHAVQSLSNVNTFCVDSVSSAVVHKLLSLLEGAEMLSQKHVLGSCLGNTGIESLYPPLLGGIGRPLPIPQSI